MPFIYEFIHSIIEHPPRAQGQGLKAHYVKGQASKQLREHSGSVQEQRMGVAVRKKQ